MADQEALLALKSARSDWVPSRLEILSEKQKRLQQSLNFLGEGLKNHFALEEDALPPFLGEFLMRSLLLAHQKIRKLLEDAKSLITDANLEGLSQEELMSRDSYLQHAIGSLSDQIEEHAEREEILLEMLKQVLVEPG